MQSIPIEAIVIGERRRQDNGDVQGLADSIAQYGLLHPPVVDAEMRLVAGGRRLAACKALGWKFIEVRSLGTLTDAELREIELEENLRRKDLTPTERSRTIAQLAETAAVADRETFRPELGTKPSGGRPAEPGSIRRVSERIGVPTSTIQKAQTHVETAEAFPFMQKPDWKQYHVLEAKEAIDRIPEPERPAVAKLIDQPATPPRDAIRMVRNLAEMPAKERAEVIRLSESPDIRDQSLALTTAHKSPPMPDPRLNRIDRAIREIEAACDPFPNDPETPLFRDVIETLRTAKSRIRKAA